RVRQTKHRLVLVNNRTIRKLEIRLIGVRAKGDLARANRGKFFDGVYHRHVGVGLIFENAQFGRAIIGHGTITIEMVGSEVKPKANGWAESTDSFQLE